MMIGSLALMLFVFHGADALCSTCCQYGYEEDDYEYEEDDYSDGGDEMCLDTSMVDADVPSSRDPEIRSCEDILDKVQVQISHDS